MNKDARHHPIRSFLIMLLIVIAVIVLGIGGSKVVQNKKAAMANIPPAKTYGLVVPVKTAVAADVILTMPYLAEIQSDSDVELASKVTARVNVIAKSGDEVKTGDVLVRLDAGDLIAKKKSLELKISEVKNQILAKQIDLKDLEKIHRHSKELLAIQAIPREKYDSEAARITSLKATITGIQQNVLMLKQNIKELEDTLSYTVIKAPIDGVISKTFVARGGIASGGKPLLALSGGKAKRLVVRVSDSIKPAALFYNRERCALTSLNSTLNGLDEYSCEIATTLPAGNRVEVKLQVFSGNGILLPTNAVLELNGKHFVLLVKNVGNEGSAQNETRNNHTETTEQAVPQFVSIVSEGSEGIVVRGVNSGDEYIVAKPDILLKLMTGVSVIRANPAVAMTNSTASAGQQH